MAKQRFFRDQRAGDPSGIQPRSRLRVSVYGILFGIALDMLGSWWIPTLPPSKGATPEHQRIRVVFSFPY